MWSIADDSAPPSISSPARCSRSAVLSGSASSALTSAASTEGSAGMFEKSIPRGSTPTGNLDGCCGRRRPRLCELAVVEPVVEALALQQLRVAALLDDLAAVHDHDRVGVADGGEPVRDHEAGPARTQAGHGRLDQDLCPRVDVAGRLVQDEDARVGKKCARDGEQLALAGGEGGSVVVEDRAVPVRL